MIETLKDLERLLKLCRKQGVTELKTVDVEFKLGDLPEEKQAVEDAVDDPYGNFPDGPLSDSQLAFYSAGGDPQDDPELKE